jgi:hypothetical protein
MCSELAEKASSTSKHFLVNLRLARVTVLVLFPVFSQFVHVEVLNIVI